MKKIIAVDHQIKHTEDGSNTLFVKGLNETYHSTHGALNEARHVFIKNGLNRIKDCQIYILELGFGTGLNVLVTLEEYIRNQSLTNIHYISLEKYPLEWAEASQLNYSALFDDPTVSSAFHTIHQCEWGKPTVLAKGFELQKIQMDFFELKNIDPPPIDLVYFDCFGAQVQPALWELPLLEIVAQKMKKGALFTTYSAKGSLRRSLKSLNFEVQKLEGPKGKREMTNAWKL